MKRSFFLYIIFKFTENLNRVLNLFPGAKHCIPVLSEDIVNFLLHLKKKGYSESTLLGYSKILRHLAKNMDLNEPEEVSEFIANKRVSEGRKQLLVDDYATYCAWKRLHFDKPFYKRAKKLPFIPLEEEVDALISGLANKFFKKRK